METKKQEQTHDSIKEKIIELLKTMDGCYFGDILRELGLSNSHAIKTIMELKSEGIIIRDSDPPLYRLA